MLDPLRTAIALIPLGCFFALWALLQWGRYPRLIDGWRETAALGVACAGLVLVGPLELFLPYAASVRFGGWVWALLAGLYFLAIVLVVNGQRRRVVVLNAPREPVIECIAAAAHALDPGTLRAGETWVLPGLGLELRIEVYRPLRSLTITAWGDEPPRAAWRAFARELRRELARCPVGPSPQSAMLFATALAMLSLSAWQLVEHPAQVAQSFRDLLRM